MSAGQVERRAVLGGLIGAALIVPLVRLAPPANAQGLDAYRVGPGDKIKITVFRHPDESGEFEVDGQGNIGYPLLGRIRAQGATLSELQEQVRMGLDKTFIVDPRVSVEVTAYRPFYIYGEVQRPGGYPFVSGLTVRRAVAIAGGFTRRARHEPVGVVREGRDEVSKLELSLDVAVLPGDIIEVWRRLF